ncbi:hypothetical protein BDD12DRAFT_895358 [Trichophaea hybrida]|nr:hypothetical protein BDD12DRAFT_895358 [Trichophaea hybrida]
MDMGLEVPADICADGTGLEIRAVDAQPVFGASESDIVRMEQTLKDLASRSMDVGRYPPGTAGDGTAPSPSVIQMSAASWGRMESCRLVLILGDVGRTGRLTTLSAGLWSSICGPGP